MALAVASAGCAFFVMRVFVGFEPLRIKALQQPRSSTNDRVEVLVADDRLATLRTPFALIARIRNEAAETQELVVGVDGSRVCRRQSAADQPTASTAPSCKAGRRRERSHRRCSAVALRGRWNISSSRHIMATQRGC